MAQQIPKFHARVRVQEKEKKKKKDIKP